MTVYPQTFVRSSFWRYATHFFLITGLAFALHLIFSPLGYNPTDDGFNLAYTRRLLEGEIPHRDFISIRPVGSPLFHLLFLPLGGDFTYLFTRGIVTLQIVIFTWLWIQILKKNFSLSLSLPHEAFLLTIATLCGLPCPLYAWYTTDGIFFGTLGVALCTFFPRFNFWGYFLIGYSVLCKQNFVFFALGAPFLLGDSKKTSTWLGGVLPSVLYLAYLACFQGLSDFFLQVRSHTSFLDVATKPYIHWTFVFPFFVGLSIPLVLRYFGKSRDFLFNGLVLILILVCSASVFIGKIRSAPTACFGLSIGFLMGALLDREKQSALIRAGSILVLLNWAGAISISGPFPHHSWGTLIIFLFLAAEKGFSFARHTALTTCLVLSGAIALSAIVYGRLYYLGEREKTAWDCVYPLDGFFPGGKGIRTNGKTHAFLVDLNLALEKVKGSKYSILPDCPGYWVKSEQRNPLPMDWVQRLEIFHPLLIERVKQSFLAEREKKTKFLIQKVHVHNLGGPERLSIPSPEALRLVDVELDFGLNEFVHYRFDENLDPRYGGYYGLTLYVIDHFTKVDETQFFEIYE